MAAGLLTAACAPATTTPPGPPVVLMSANESGGFFSLPWPNAVRKTPSGHLDLNGMPGVAIDLLSGKPLPPIPLLPVAIANAADAVTDFGTNTAVYFQTSTELDPTSLPTPGQSRSATASVALLDLDGGGAAAPIVVRFRATGDDFRPADTMSLLPYPGHPLHPGHRYAAVVFDSVRAVDGSPLQPASLISQLDAPWSTSTGVSSDTWNGLRSQRDDVRAAVAASGRDPARVVAFTEYRTQDVGADMAAVAATVASLPQPQLQVTSQGACGPDAKAGGTRTSRLDGTISMPNFQSGQYPFLTSGGAIQTDGAGHGVVVSVRDVTFSARVPCGPPPVGGWPIAAFIDGTGGDANIDSSAPPFDRKGWAVGVIAPGMTGATDPLLTAVGLTSDQQTELLFYNFLNPVAGRGNGVQQAADHLMLLRGLVGLQLAGGPLESATPVTANPAIQLIAGQSQGAGTLPLVAANNHQITGVISGAGGAGLYHSVAHGYSRRSLFAELTGDINAMDELNPLQQLLQTVIEETDGSNYPDATANYLNVSGVQDACVTIESARHLDASIGLTVLNRQAPAALYGDPALEPASASLPYTTSSGPVRVDVEHPQTHWGGYDAATATLRNSFVQSIAAGTRPVIPASAYATSPRIHDSCAGRWDAPGTAP